MSAVELTAIAGVIAAIVAVIGLATAAIYRVGKLAEATDRIPMEMKLETQGLKDRIDQHEDLNREQFRHNEELLRHNEELIKRNEELAEERFRRNEELSEERFRRNEQLAEERSRRIESLIRSEGEITREQIRNLHQAIMSHSHDEDGNIIFRVPPSTPGE